MSHYPYIDRNPCIVAAGKPTRNSCDTAKELMIDVRLQDKVDAIRKQFGFIEPKDYGREWFKPAEIDTLGAFTEIRHCLRPPLQTTYQALDEEVKNTFYDSYWNKPLGKSRDQTPGLPIGMDPEAVTMGKPSERSENAGAIVNPPRKHEEVMLEEKYYHDLYAFSHQNLYPGEHVNLWYTPPFNRKALFGITTKKDESGKNVQRCLNWFNNDPLCHVSRRQAALRSRTKPTIGKGLDRTGVTDMVPEDHTYGKPSTADFYGVEDLFNECTPSLVRRDMLNFLSYANLLRQIIHKKISAGDLSLEDLYEEIMAVNKNQVSIAFDGSSRHLTIQHMYPTGRSAADFLRQLTQPNKNSDCSVNFDCIDRIMKRHRIYLDHEKVQPLLLTLGILSEDGKIKVRDFISFIDKNARFPDIKKQCYLMPPEYQDCLKSFNKYEIPKDIHRIQSMPAAGMPSIRLDKPYPVYAHTIANMCNLSEETKARALISPSIFTQYGLSHRDFFQPRSKEFLGKLFRKIKVTISDEELDEIYEEGFKLDQTGGVCVETFRNILDERAYKEYYKFFQNKT